MFTTFPSARVAYTIVVRAVACVNCSKQSQQSARRTASEKSRPDLLRRPGICERSPSLSARALAAAKRVAKAKRAVVKDVLNIILLYLRG